MPKFKLYLSLPLHYDLPLFNPLVLTDYLIHIHSYQFLHWVPIHLLIDPGY